MEESTLHLDLRAPTFKELLGILIFLSLSFLILKAAKDRRKIREKYAISHATLQHTLSFFFLIQREVWFLS